MNIIIFRFLFLGLLRNSFVTLCTENLYLVKQKRTKNPFNLKSVYTYYLDRQLQEKISMSLIFGFPFLLKSQESFHSVFGWDDLTDDCEKRKQQRFNISNYSANNSQSGSNRS